MKKEEILKGMAGVYEDSDDWRKGVVEGIKERDVGKIRKEALPHIQAEVVRIALEGKSEQTRLSASQFVLGQEAEGAIQRIDAKMGYEALPMDQLLVSLKSKMGQLLEAAPELRGEIEGLIEGEYVEVEAPQKGGNGGRSKDE